MKRTKPFVLFTLLILGVVPIALSGCGVGGCGAGPSNTSLNTPTPTPSSNTATDTARGEPIGHVAIR